MVNENITDHYKKYRVIEGDKLLLETAKNNYQKGKDESSLDIAELKARITILTQGCKIICEREKSELIEKIKEKALLHKRDTKWRQPVLDYWNFMEILDTFKQAEKKE
jgi:phage host-nuclease inhibitor protein Gam